MVRSKRILAAAIASAIGLGTALSAQNTGKVVRHHKIAENDPLFPPELTQAEGALEQKDYATAQPLLEKLTLKATKLRLEHGDNGPQWRVQLWAAKLKKPGDDADIGVRLQFHQRVAQVPAEFHRQRVQLAWAVQSHDGETGVVPVDQQAVLVHWRTLPCGGLRHKAYLIMTA